MRALSPVGALQLHDPFVARLERGSGETALLSNCDDTLECGGTGGLASCQEQQVDARLGGERGELNLLRALQLLRALRLLDLPAAPARQGRGRLRGQE